VRPGGCGKGESGGGLADQKRYGVFQLGPLHVQVDRLCLGGFELGLRQEHVRLGSHPACVPVPGQVKRLLKAGNRRIKELFLSILDAEQEIVLGKFCLG
jgi:hypothetical protein